MMFLKKVIRFFNLKSLFLIEILEIPINYLLLLPVWIGEFIGDFFSNQG